MFPSDSELGLNPMPQESTLDKVLKWGSLGTSLLGAAGKAGLVGGGPTAAATPGVGGGIPGVNYTPGNPAKLPVAGGGAGGSASSRSPYLDLLMKTALNDFGIGQDATYSNSNSMVPYPETALGKKGGPPMTRR
jgi:hypothetical protein